MDALLCKLWRRYFYTKVPFYFLDFALLFRHLGVFLKIVFFNVFQAKFIPSYWFKTFKDELFLTCNLLISIQKKA